MTHSFWFLSCDAMATYRLAILASKDKITEPARERLRTRAYTPQANPRDGGRAAASRWTFELVSCPWCIGVWIAAGVVALTALAPDIWQYLALWLALSGAAGFLAER